MRTRLEIRRLTKAVMIEAPTGMIALKLLEISLMSNIGSTGWHLENMETLKEASKALNHIHSVPRSAILADAG
ncbi:hypothetical protein N7520_000042 [Penicillium odoratum]|uniref:uncharacterized protein n=1 Tax=Penicillium odoratum TaxID=1167516 RepID=UPI002547D886|nr:uncharacterized protein N7520_000042 [Penicillium odoratum]KAJ5776796.1 hypothetical protein N7520_000042 [Penicillium odoratum]